MHTASNGIYLTAVQNRSGLSTGGVVNLPATGQEVFKSFQ
jgi:hypothetical protein